MKKTGPSVIDNPLDIIRESLLLGFKAIMLSKEHESALATSRILVVGAGGIGCELLKNLALSSCRSIDLIDLDTIDVSNLNRQFLFRKSHVSMSKAHVAREAALKFNPNLTINSHHANIKDEQFGAAYFKQFDLVMNALDNIDARRHVNRLCLALSLPLIESGTQGYLGQVTTISKGRTECFECQPRDVPKTYAVCTIRNTPDQPVHCVVWAKFIFNMLFGPNDPDNIMLDQKSDEILQDEHPQQHWTQSLSQSGSTADQARIIFQRLFHTEMAEAAAIKDRWQARAAPIALDLDQLLSEGNTRERKAGETAANVGAVAANTDRTPQPAVLRGQQVGSMSECAQGLIKTLVDILEQRKDQIGQIEFDKDDDLLMDCISDLANLRMYCFHIAPQSRFHVKGIAGNIVHAIATTNAIAAGLMVIEAIKVLTGNIAQCRTTWIKRYGPRVLQPQQLDPPNPNCYVCNRSQAVLTLDTGATTLRQFFKEVCRSTLGLNEPTIDVVNRDNFIGCEDDHNDDDDDDDAGGNSYLDRFLSDPGVRISDGAILSIEDLSQQLSISIVVHHSDEVEGFQLDRTGTSSLIGKKRSREDGSLEVEEVVA